MPVYKYKAIGSGGRAVEGTITVRSRDEVLAFLRQNGQVPVNVQEFIEGKDIKTLSLFNKVKIKDIAVFCRQFHAMLNAGVTIINCLDILRQQVENKKLRAVCGDMFEQVQKGMTFHESLLKHKSVFPELLINMVAVGEASGNLDTIMERMATHFEKENKLNSKVKGAMVYPIMLGILSVVVVVFMLVFVMPTFVGMFQGAGIELPLPTRMVLAGSNAIRKFWYIFLAVISATAYIISRLSKIPEIKYRTDSMKLKLPVIGITTKKVLTSRLARTLSTLLSSGMPLLQSLEVISKIMGNTKAEEAIQAAKDEVRKGTNLSVPLKKCGIFPPMLISMVKIGEESGSLDDILERTANYYDDEVEEALERTVKLMEPLMLIVMAIVVGGITIAMILPMFGMLQTVQM